MSCEPEAQGLGSRLATRPHVELAQDGRNVVVDRPLRQVEPHSDVTVPHALGYEAENLHLARCQARGILLCGRLGPAPHTPGAALTQTAGYNSRCCCCLQPEEGLVRGTICTPPGEPHTVGPAGEDAVEMIVEFRPALGFERFVERTFALDRAGHLNAKGRGNPLRLATARPHEAEFFVPRVPIGLQRAILRALDRLGRWLPDARG